jgi:predicted enzyme related to lactoylglutathione lyase
MSQSHPVVHFEILGKDQKLLETFYKGVFDWEIAPVMEGYSMIKPGGGINGGLLCVGCGRKRGA